MKISLRRQPVSRHWQPSRWSESTQAEYAWGKSRLADTRWAATGATLGVCVALLLYAPASWVAQAVAAASDHRLLLADARGSIWKGSAVAVLTGGTSSRDAAALPGRLEWSVGLSGASLEVSLSQVCCLTDSVAIRLRPGLSKWHVTLAPSKGWIGQWPSAWLSGLGTPWNTLQLGGTLRIASAGITLKLIDRHWHVVGQAQAELLDATSRLSTLRTLGSYRLQLVGNAANAGRLKIDLSTQKDAALQLSGSGTWGPSDLHFRGEASARLADEAALGNLLNIIGRRDGARSVISIG